jgi:uncharacterized protein
MNPDILTCSGSYFNFLEPEECAVDIKTIAHALSHICRFTGHVREFYSVAQHSVMVSYLVEPEHALAGLLHDAPEAFIGDVAAPLKQLLPDYKAIEKRVEAAVLGAFGLPAKLPESVKRADLIMLATEQRDLMPAIDHTWQTLQGIEPMLAKLTPMKPNEAKTLFMIRFAELTNGGARQCG